MAFVAPRSGVVKKRSEILRSLVPTFFGLLFGVAIGVSFMKFGIVPDTGVVFNQEVQHQKQLDATRNAVTCPGAQPLGTESLPRDILATLSDLYPRRLWGKPEEDLQDKPKYLLTLTVGLKQKNFVNQCVQKFSKEWQIILFHYDGHVNEWDDLEWSARAIHISTRSQTKWWYAKRFLHPDIVEPYEYIFIWDEDLDVEHFNAEKYVQLIKKFGLEISQPGLEPDRGLTWQMTKRLGTSEVHKETVERQGWCSDPHKPPCAGFVEIMAPVFSRKAWRCIWHIIQNDLVHGWGLDFSLQRCVQPAHEKIGVVDAQWLRHRVVPSLGDQGEVDTSKPATEGVRDRCKYEWGLYTERWKMADEKQKLEIEAQKKQQT
ncbi:hypothetical protein CY35_04G094600 [Sphagnum magellanicum]|nr:hypothetical protein CY35_04G094600 [Sphagnum magellanicum]KAH9565764.1 hypothetical protein CY35_04G094600 [Sphagnum magellanicum]